MNLPANNQHFAIELLDLYIYCLAFVNNSVDKYPFKVKKTPCQNQTLAVLIVCKNNQIIIPKRKRIWPIVWSWGFSKLLDKIKRDCLI